MFFALSLQVKSCQTSGECSQGYQCCGGSPNSEGTCCEEKYYYEFTKLPCISHLGCQVNIALLTLITHWMSSALYFFSHDESSL